MENIAKHKWFARYPWPTQFSFDRGSEFTEKESKQMLVHDYGTRTKSISVRNPQANVIVERIHQAIVNMVTTFKVEKNYLDVDNSWKGVLSQTALAIQLIYHAKFT